MNRCSIGSCMHQHYAVAEHMLHSNNCFGNRFGLFPLGAFGTVTHPHAYIKQIAIDNCEFLRLRLVRSEQWNRGLFIWFCWHNLSMNWKWTLDSNSTNSTGGSWLQRFVVQKSFCGKPNPINCEWKFQWFTSWWVWVERNKTPECMQLKLSVETFVFSFLILHRFKWLTLDEYEWHLVNWWLRSVTT